MLKKIEHNFIFLITYKSSLPHLTAVPETRLYEMNDGRNE